MDHAAAGTYLKLTNLQFPDCKILCRFRMKTCSGSATSGIKLTTFLPRSRQGSDLNNESPRPAGTSTFKKHLLETILAQTLANSGYIESIVYMGLYVNALPHRLRRPSHNYIPAQPKFYILWLSIHWQQSLPLEP